MPAADTWTYYFEILFPRCYLLEGKEVVPYILHRSNKGLGPFPLKEKSSLENFSLKRGGF